MVKRPSAPTTSNADTADTLAVESSRPSERSWLSGLWASGWQCLSRFQSNYEIKGLQVPKADIPLLLVDTVPQKPLARTDSLTTPSSEHNRCL